MCVCVCSKILRFPAQTRKVGESLWLGYGNGMIDLSITFDQFRLNHIQSYPLTTSPLLLLLCIFNQKHPNYIKKHNAIAQCYRRRAVFLVHT